MFAVEVEEASGVTWVYLAAQFNPFTHAVEWMRFALYGKDPGVSPCMVFAILTLCRTLTCWGYGPQRSFGGLTKRGGPTRRSFC